MVIQLCPTREDIRSDIYSLGCTLYKLLAGRAPFVGPEYKKDFQKMMAHVHNAPPPISLVRSDLPPELMAIIERMMAKAPADRFAEPAEVAAALAPLSSGCDLAGLAAEALGGVELPAAPASQTAATDKLSASPHTDTASPLAPVLRGEGPGVRGDSLAHGERIGVRGGSGRRRLWLILAAAAAAIPLLLGVWIIIRDKHGKEVGRMQIPEGGSMALVDDQGQPVKDGKVISTPAPDAATVPPVTPSSPPLVVGPPVKPSVSLDAIPDSPETASQEAFPGGLVPRPVSIPGVKSWTIETRGHRGYLPELVYSPDGSRFATAGSDRTIRVWDSSDGRLIQAIVGGGAAFAWSPDGSLLATGGDAISVRDAKTARILKTFPPIENADGIARLDWSADGKHIAALIRRPGASFCSDIEIWSVESGRRQQTVQPGSGVTWLRWSPDRSVLAFTALGKNMVGRWDLEKQELLPDLEHKGAIWADWSSDGKLLASSGDKIGVRIWDHAFSRLVNEFPGSGATWSRDGKLIAARSVSGDKILVVDPVSGKTVRSYPLPHDASAGTWDLSPIVWSPDGKSFALGSSRTMAVLDAQTGVPRLSVRGHNHGTGMAVAWSADQTRVAVNVGTEDVVGIRVFDVARGEQVRCLPVPSGGSYGHIAWSPDGRKLAAGSANNALYDVELGKTLRVWSGASVRSQAWSPDGRMLAVGPAQTGPVTLFDVDNGKPVATFPVADPYECRALAWSPDGKLMAAAEQKTSVWNVESRKMVLEIRSPTRAIAFSPDGATIALGLVKGYVQLHETASGRLIRELPGHGAAVRCLRWSLDGKRLISGGQDGTLAVWNVETGQLVRAMSGIKAGSISPDGKYVGGPHPDGSLGPCIARIWETENGDLQSTILALGNDAWAILSPAGHFRGSPGVEAMLVYVVQTDAGLETLSPEEFSKKYGWKNDPSKVQLLLDASEPKPEISKPSPPTSDQPNAAKPKS